MSQKETKERIKQIKRTFPFGTAVTVRRFLQRKTPPNSRRRVWEPTAFWWTNSVEGIVIGWKYLHNGSVDYWSDGASFNCKETFLALEIRTGMLNKSLFARPDDVAILLGDPLKIPEILVAWSEGDRKFLKEDSKNWPRNSKGQWT